MKTELSGQVKSILWDHENRSSRYWTCPQCETENDTYSVECLVCGYRHDVPPVIPDLPVPPTPPTPPVKPPKTRGVDKALKIIAIAALAVVGVAVLILLL